jgi:hypothetical protein
VADLDDSLQTYELGLVDFVATEGFGVIAKVAQEPVQLPEGFRTAIEATRQDVACKPAGFKNGKRQCVIGFLGLPLKAHALHPDEEDPIRDLVGSTAIGGVEAGDLALFAASHELNPEAAAVLKRCHELLFLALAIAANRINTALKAPKKK